MKLISNYIKERLTTNKDKIIENDSIINELYDKINFIGDYPTKKLARVLLLFEFNNNNDKIDIEYNSKNKIINFVNVKKIKGTLKQYIRLFDELNRYNIIFPDEIEVHIRSGKDMQRRIDWPYIDNYNQHDYKYNWSEVVYLIGENDPNRKISVYLNRFDCKGTLFNDTFKLVYIDSITFTECPYQTSMILPNESNCYLMRNPKLKLYSDKKEANKYYKLNGFQ